MAGRAEFEDELKEDVAFWSDCDSQWGLGGGYRNTIASKSRDWFSVEPHQAKGSAIAQLIVAAWTGICGRLRGTIGRVSTAP